MYTYIHVYIYIYIEREREIYAYILCRYIYMYIIIYIYLSIYLSVSLYISLYIYIYIHITLLDLCVSSLRRGHANIICIVPIFTDDPGRAPTALREDVNSPTVSFQNFKFVFAA